jgi:DinB superfamily
MDRITKAISRLWGGIGADGRLHGPARFAEELAAQCNGRLPLRAPTVSKWSFGQQLEHLYLTSHYVLDRLEESMSGANQTSHMGPWGVGMMIGGFIPRGVFPTIPPLEPKGGNMETIAPLKQSLEERLARIDWSLEEIGRCRGKSRHPRMKYLTSSQWLFFQDIHHRHHLAIQRDIAAAAGPRS